MLFLPASFRGGSTKLLATRCRLPLTRFSNRRGPGSTGSLSASMRRRSDSPAAGRGRRGKAERQTVPRTKKSLGQHFLVDAGVLRAIAKEVRRSAREAQSVGPVLEIGPGSGNLTRYLLDEVAPDTCADGDDGSAAITCAPSASGKRQLHVVEVDPRMVRLLAASFSPAVERGVLKIHHCDVLDFMDSEIIGEPGVAATGRFSESAAGTLNRFPVVVGNLPYNLSSPIFARMMAQQNGQRAAQSEGTGNQWWDHAVVMTQKEFADRVLGTPGSSNYSRLSVTTAVFLHVRRVCDVGRSSFSPPPKVDSTVIAMQQRSHDLTISEIAQLDLLLRTCFHRKNKTLRSVFRRLCPAQPSNVLPSGKIHQTTKKKKKRIHHETSLPSLQFRDSGAARPNNLAEDAVFESALQCLGGLATMRAREIEPSQFVALLRQMLDAGLEFTIAVSQRGQ